LRIKPFDKESNNAQSSIFKFVDLRLAFDESAIESCFQDRTVMACEVFVDDEGLGIFAYMESYNILKVPVKDNQRPSLLRLDWAVFGDGRARLGNR